MAQSQATPLSSQTQAPKLLDRLRGRLQARGFGLDMQNGFIEWCRQFILFHNKRHPAAMGALEVGDFLHDLAARRLPLGWRREAWEALGFLYREELGRVVALPDVRRDFPLDMSAEPVAAAPQRELASANGPPPALAPLGKPRLLDQVRQVLRVRHYKWPRCRSQEPFSYTRSPAFAAMRRVVIPMLVLALSGPS